MVVMMMVMVTKVVMKMITMMMVMMMIGDAEEAGEVGSTVVQNENPRQPSRPYQRDMFHGKNNVCKSARPRHGLIGVNRSHHESGSLGDSPDLASRLAFPVEGQGFRVQLGFGIYGLCFCKRNSSGSRLLRNHLRDVL